MGQQLVTDYLVVGAGAAGMAFADELLAHTEATVTIVDHRDRPGGHWVDAYDYVRLHQPSAFYGVSSVLLGEDAIDASGLNTGFYELASADEIRAYYRRVMDRHFLPSGRLRYFPSSDYVGEHRFVSRLSGATTEVRVNRKLVDTTYMEGTIPATSPPPFEVADGVRCVPAGALARLDEPVDRFVIIGAGKTALDACVWLLERGVPAASICWIKPREGWWLNRRFQQPHAQLPELYRGVAIQLEAMAQASSVDEVFERLEAEGVFLRVDPTVTPTMCRGAIISEAELSLLRQIEDVVRLGRVQRIERDEIVLDEGTVATSSRTLHVHCAARGLIKRPPRPIFETSRITVQPCRWGFACYQFALLAVVEALVDSDDQKNQLCTPIGYWEKNADYLASYLATMRGDRARGGHAAVSQWTRTTRLNPTSGLASQLDHPVVADARARIKRHGAAAAANLQTLLASSAEAAVPPTSPAT